MILYRTNVSASDLRAGATLYVASRVRDSAVVSSSSLLLAILLHSLISPWSVLSPMLSLFLPSEGDF